MMNRATRSQGSGTTKGCGCSQAAGGCSCGGECGECHVKGLVRPLFFAGQLLTEDDLGALTDYVRAKGRLHNQALFGAGVVNGLHVSCHPCDEGRVVVQPGYAIDCCGNDLLLQAAQEVDIEAMVRRLALERLGGIDCADPCPQAAEQPRGDREPRAARPTRYGLYLRYCETETDPVAAYATGEACGERSCEATRVREGVRFELRCCEEPVKEDVIARLGRYLGDLVSNERSIGEAVVLQLSSAQLREALAEHDRGNTFDPSEDRGTMNTLTSELSDLIGRQAWDQNDVLHATDTVRRLGALVTLFRLSVAVLLRDSSDIFSQLTVEISDAQAQLREAERRLKLPETLQKVDVVLMRDVLLATVSLSARFTDFEATGEKVEGNSSETQPSPPSFQEQLFAQGGVFTAQLQSSFSRALDALRSTLYERLGATHLLADCRLRSDLQGIVLPGEASSQEVFPSDVQTFLDATVRLLAASLRFVLDCFCAALNPPSQACDDTAVLLACVSVEQCKVVDVCNLERTYVLSGTAFRYWLPPLGWLGALLEFLCCDGRSYLSELGRGKSAGSLIERITGGQRPESAALRLASDGFASYYGLQGLRARELERIGQLVAVLSRTTSRQLDLAQRLRGPERGPAVRPAPPIPVAPPIPERVQPRAEAEPVDIEAIVDRIKRDPQALAALADAVAKVKRGRNS